MSARDLSGKERVSLSLIHEEPDRVPYCELWVSNNIISSVLGRTARAGVGSGTPHYDAIRAAARGEAELQSLTRAAMSDHLTFCQTVGIDVAMIRLHHFAPGVYSKAYLGPNGLYDSLIIEETGDRNFLLQHPSGFWSRLTYEQGMGSIMETDDAISHGGIEELRRYVDYLESRPLDLPPSFRIVLDCMREAVTSDAGRSLFVLGTADVCFPMFLHFIPVFLEAMAVEPELVDRYMRTSTDGVLALLREQLALGVDGIIGTNDIAFKSGLMFSVGHFRRFIAPYLREIVEECHRSGVPYIKHLDGDINAIVPILVDEICVDALHALEPSAKMDIVALKKSYGDRVSLWGNLDCGQLLTWGTTDEITAEVRRIIKEIAPGGGFGFSSSNAIHVGVPEENFRSVLRAVKEYGKYPIAL